MSNSPDQLVIPAPIAGTIHFEGIIYGNVSEEKSAPSGTFNSLNCESEIGSDSNAISVEIKVEPKGQE